MHSMNFKNMAVATLTALALGLVWLLPKYLNLPTSHFVTLALQILASLVIALLGAFFFYRQKMQAQAAPKNNSTQKRFSKIKKVGNFLKIKSIKLYRYIHAQLQPHLRKKNQLLNHLPWYLFIGNPQSGKSSLLYPFRFEFRCLSQLEFARH
jgi:type VI protein secretion system component VasK